MILPITMILILCVRLCKQSVVDNRVSKRSVLSTHSLGVLIIQSHPWNITIIIVVDRILWHSKILIVRLASEVRRDVPAGAFRVVVVIYFVLICSVNLSCFIFLGVISPPIIVIVVPISVVTVIFTLNILLTVIIKPWWHLLIIIIIIILLIILLICSVHHHVLFY